MNYNHHLLSNNYLYNDYYLPSNNYYNNYNYYQQEYTISFFSVNLFDTCPRNKKSLLNSTFFANIIFNPNMTTWKEIIDSLLSLYSKQGIHYDINKMYKLRFYYQGNYHDIYDVNSKINSSINVCINSIDIAFDEGL